MPANLKLNSTHSTWFKIVIVATLFSVSGIATALNKVVVVPMSGEDLKPLKNIITVAKANGDFDNPVDALNSIPNTGLDAPSETNPYLIIIAPGTYEITDQIAMRQWISISGSGEKSTKISGEIGTAGESSSSIVLAANDTSITDLTIENRGKPGFAWSLGIYLNGRSPLIERVSIVVSGGSNGNYGIYALNSSPTINHLTALASGTNGFGVFINGSRSAPLIQNSNLTGDSYGLRLDGSSTAARVVYSRILGGVFDPSGATQCLGNFSGTLAPVNC